MPIYPIKVSVWEKLLANVSQVFNIAPTKRIEVDLFRQKMKIFEDGKVVKEFLISTGHPETPTPTGRFKVLNRFIMIHSSIANCWLPFWVGFTPDGLYGFHEIPICKEGRRGLEELGEPTSMGCVRLGIGDSETFYRWVRVGTPVIIHGKEPQVFQEEKLEEELREKEMAWCYDFMTDLEFGDTNNEVRNLQIALSKNPEIYPEGIISGWFGFLTKTAIIRFQEKHRDEILVPWGLIRGTGFVGHTTRNKLNQLYGCP